MSIQRTYAFFDLIGVKQAFKAGSAPELLGAFWKAAEAWATFFSKQVLVESRLIPVTANLVTFSDSALLTTLEQIAIDDFYAIASELHKKLLTVGDTYCIVSSADEIAHHSLPGAGIRLVDGDMRPSYINIAGSGAAFAELFSADLAIKGRPDWKANYNLYCVGNGAVTQAHPAKDSMKSKGVFGTIEVHALNLVQ